uniref:Uncharacterized protein n=1 Tax=Panagrolaimus davidi TaxID=227884 RepID=A0A914Q1E4_9BILA
MDNLDSLASDGENYEHYGNDVKFFEGGGKAERELENNELTFRFCSDGCMKKTVIACDDSTNPNPNAKCDCGPNQYEFMAGVSEGDDKVPFLWFYDKFHNKGFPKNGHICATITMKFPDATSDGIRPFPSYEPLKHDGNVVKLYVQQVPSGCLFYNENAKIWAPPPPTTTTKSSPYLSKEATSKSSEASTTLWIGISVGIFILLIAVIGFGYCCYRTQIQKQPQEKQAKPTKKKAPAAKKVSIEPTLENPTTEASVVRKSVVQQQQKQPGNLPIVFVPKKVILPAPKSINAPKNKSHTSKKDSLSGRHEVGMQIMVESAPESLKHHDFGMLNDESKEKLENNNARKSLTENGVTFDEKSNIIEMSPKAEKYLHSKSTPEFVRSFAFGNVFREFIDSQARVHETFSIPLLWTIVLQRRYTAYNRRKACTWIR